MEEKLLLELHTKSNQVASFHGKSSKDYITLDEEIKPKYPTASDGGICTKDT